ncbi:hypothetical protein COCC4DRAFT_127123 [Bipolaris maydis ATCC 48331]|uniref:Uncharacterized protein n=2 Tax=Cochliobolus heterostrophus TaxID=5016 RepID=M2TVC5_COCH5|nr:uncharacterized protein COCC4DRAFT_127123 [Bipolaris maydis ATCC 48331]EMD90489.1 hypothetical protein COCHEDRAFT_1157496 [Bipolaris maydis C5]ENI09299.1 hypothetical protein COCC4DRAFT_127123 [Bipolaris maydis ATCC 48331]KAJ6206393.1 hypothetical protein PSV09DRAFT_1157496 [Bipolaris maydis]
MMTRGVRIIALRVLRGSRNTEHRRFGRARWQSALGRGYVQIADARPKIGGLFFVFVVDATVVLCPNVGAATRMSLSMEASNHH